MYGYVWFVLPRNYALQMHFHCSSSQVFFCFHSKAQVQWVLRFSFRNLESRLVLSNDTSIYFLNILKKMNENKCSWHVYRLNWPELCESCKLDSTRTSCEYLVLCELQLGPRLGRGTKSFLLAMRSSLRTPINSQDKWFFSGVVRFVGSEFSKDLGFEIPQLSCIRTYVVGTNKAASLFRSLLSRLLNI